MKQLKVVLAALAMVLLFWACSEDSSTINSSTDVPQADVFETVDELDAPSELELSLEKGGNVYGTFEVKFYNLTPATGPGASQVMSPPVLVTHSKKVRLFKRGNFASDEIRQIAEDAVNGPMVAALNASDKVQEVVEGPGVVFPGESATYTIGGSKKYSRLSLVTMLVNTNDAFAAANRVKLPKSGYREYYLYSYDAGTEENTELRAHIPGPCCGNPLVRVPEHKRIKFHPGIQGHGDLDPAVYDWDEPTAKIVITRID